MDREDGSGCAQVAEVESTACHGFGCCPMEMIMVCSSQLVLLGQGGRASWPSHNYL